MTRSGAVARNVKTGGDPGAAPRDAADVAEAVAAASARGQALRLVAGGTWLDAGRPVREAITLDLSALSGIVEYTPGDLTLTARAATPLATIAAATAAHGQWLSLDPFGTGGTLGATLATASAGPLAATIGRPRDVALGIEVVSGAGERIRAGGRVVKNVAGFDLVRLQVGAWGTLGVITEATVRLRATPAVDRTVSLTLPQLPAAAAESLRRLRHLAFTPPAAELLNAPLAGALGLEAEPVVLVRVSGNAEAVSAQLAAIAALGRTQDAPPGVWDALARAEPSGASVVRCSTTPSNLAELWHRILAALPAGHGLAHATPDRGVVRVILGPDVGPDPADLLRVLPTGAARVVERATPAEWAGVEPYAADRHSARLRAAFDPAGILNPGILGVARG